LVQESPHPVLENKDSFVTRLNFFLPETSLSSVMNAYALAKLAHDSQKREGGERYFEHPRSVALIGIDECGIRDPDIISALLLHDVFEDSEYFGSNSSDIPYSVKRQRAFNKISSVWNQRVAEMVLAVSKAPFDDIEVLTKKDKYDIYEHQLENASPEALIVKMCDRLHNLRTLSFRSKSKQTEVVTETLNEYMPIFKGAHSAYPSETEYLIAAMNSAMQNLSDTL